MPELPDILLYLHALAPRVIGRTIDHVRVVSPFVVRTFDPPIESIEGRTVARLARIGKRIVFEFQSDDDETKPLFLVIHPMIAGRLRWDERRSGKPPGKIGLASITFPNGTLHLVESSPKKRASIHLVRGKAALGEMNPGGVDVFTCNFATFANQLRTVNHTLKRSLTDPKLVDGIGNAYSDEILHAARLSPVTLTQRLDDDEIARLLDAARSTLDSWTRRLRRQFEDRFPGPGDVTAFRPEFAVHGKFGKPCPVCGTTVQRIRYAENETNYCPRCQTGGKLLADRSLSRLLKNDWPKSIEELEG
jgi:formamidopyrimidine-DNA glycosylase